MHYFYLIVLWCGNKIETKNCCCFLILGIFNKFDISYTLKNCLPIGTVCQFRALEVTTLQKYASYDKQSNALLTPTSII